MSIRPDPAHDPYAESVDPSVLCDTCEAVCCRLTVYVMAGDMVPSWLTVHDEHGMEQMERADDGWCEDPADRNYNRLVKLSPGSSADRLTREDSLYDLVLVLGHNDRPRVKGRGSAIFVHLARPGYAPTAGCIALSQHDLLMLLAELRRGSAIVVTL